MKKVTLHKVLNKLIMDMIFLKQKKLIKIQMESKKQHTKEDQMEKLQDLLKKKMLRLENIIKKE